MTAPPGDKRRVFVVEQGGRIRLLVGGKRVRRPFLDLRSDVTAGGEQGLLGLAFAPDYARSGLFYVYFTARDGSQKVQEFRRSSRNANRANKASRRQVMSMADPYPNHNGGQPRVRARRLPLHRHGGRRLRRRPGEPRAEPRLAARQDPAHRPAPARVERYRSPKSNPFVGRAGRNEIYAYGLRNPWRYSFDRRTGDLYIGDVGQNSRRGDRLRVPGRGPRAQLRVELLRGQPHASTTRAAARAPSARRSSTGAPAASARSRAAWCRATRGVPDLAGRYVYGDFCAGRLRSFRIAERQGDRRPRRWA